MVKLIRTGDYPSGSILMSNWNDNYVLNLKNHIRQLIDRAGVYSKDGTDLWGEAYTSATGRNGSVGTGETDLFYSSPIYRPKFTLVAENDTLTTSSSSGTWADTANAFDGDHNTSASVSLSSNSTSQSYTFGTTFSEKTIGVIYYDASIQGNISGNTSFSLRIQSYDGVDWVNEFTITSTSGAGINSRHQGTYNLNKSVQGVRLAWSTFRSSGTITQRAYVFDYGDPLESIITHTIPSGTFPSNVSSAIGTALVEDWETGADIQYKLTNTTEDTGWLTPNEVNEFTAFTIEPTKLIVKLIPKSVSPVSGTPSIKGFAIKTGGN